MIPLGAGSPTITVPDKYDPDLGGPHTIGPNAVLEIVQFTVSQYSVFVQLAIADQYGNVTWTKLDLPYPPGTWTIEGVAGIRFRNAVAGLASIVSAIGYQAGDPRPFPINQVANGKLQSNGVIFNTPTVTTLNGAQNRTIYTPPAGCTGIKIELWGAGAGGSSALAAAGAISASAGGGSGAYIAYFMTIPYIGAIGVDQIGVQTKLAITLGLGGAGGAAGASNEGIKGGDSIIGPEGSLRNLFIAGGGNPGQNAGSGITNTPWVQTTGGLGGAPQILAVTGTDGFLGGYGLEGGAGENGIAFNGANPSPVAGGGNAPLGHQGGQTLRNEHGTTAGANAQGYGGGGGGGTAINGSAAGGNGGDGMCVITEFYD